MDKTNKTTNLVNRLINLSEDIYTVENCSTLAEIRSTVAEKVSPYGSQIMVRFIGVVEVVVRGHSRMIVLFVNMKKAAHGATAKKRTHITVGAVL